jgi:hypothetical protein
MSNEKILSLNSAHCDDTNDTWSKHDELTIWLKSDLETHKAIKCGQFSVAKDDTVELNVGVLCKNHILLTLVEADKMFDDQVTYKISCNKDSGDQAKSVTLELDGQEHTLLWEGIEMVQQTMDSVGGIVGQISNIFSMFKTPIKDLFSEDGGYTFDWSIKDASEDNDSTYFLGAESNDLCSIALIKNDDLFDDVSGDL